MYTLFNTAIDLAHAYLARLLLPHDLAIDATCGNGKDALVLARLLPQGRLFALDIQEKSLQNSRALLAEQGARVKFFLQSHAQFPPEIAPGSVRLIVYNLGYLP